MSRVVLTPKLQGETKTYTFDFSSSLGTTETISTQVCTASVYSGTDATPSTIISGSATASGNVVSQNLTDGVVGVVYVILCTITTSLGQTLKLSGFFTIIPNTP